VKTIDWLPLSGFCTSPDLILSNVMAKNAKSYQTVDTLLFNRPRVKTISHPIDSGGSLQRMSAAPPFQSCSLRSAKLGS
jgi:hypothetical protein